MAKQSAKHAIKQFLRWAIWGVVLFFMVHTLVLYWPEIRHVQLREQSEYWLALACGVTLAAHCWAGWVWHWLLQDWGLSLSGLWAVRVYLLTNVAKYLPGNVWHFVGRVRAVQKAGGGLGRSLVSVVAEPLVMAVAALGVAAVFSLPTSLLSWMNSPDRMGVVDWFGSSRLGHGPLWSLGLLAGWAIALCLLHPYWLNPRLAQMSQLKLRYWSSRQSVSTTSMDEQRLKLERYPLLPLLGETGFVLGRSLGFILTVMALTPVSLSDMPLLVSAFCLAWLLGLVVPGAPGGVGVFEATATALLSGQLPIGAIVGSVVCYRLIGTLAELIGAVVFWIQERIWPA